jgi:uncharacterized protein
MKPFLSAEWTNLGVASFEIDKNILKKYLPPKTELNDWHGSYFMSLVGFMFSNPCFLGWKAPFYRIFEELNLRFYVKYKAGNAWKNGVVFIKEISPSKLIGLTARFLYHENFISLPMKHTISNTGTQQQTDYFWKINGKWNFFKLRTGNIPLGDNKDTIESFICNHYHGYTKASDKRSFGFEVKHIPWKIFPAIDFQIDLDAEAVYGNELASFFYRKPLTCFMMDGSYIEISRPALI